MDPASMILAVAEKLWGLKEHFRKTRRERRDQAADYFDAVSACLTEVSGSLRAEVIPHGKCAEMEGYARMLPDTIGDVVGDQEAQQQAEMLATANEIEWLVSGLAPGDPEREQRLTNIDRASGIFKALATSTRAAR